MTLVTLCRLPCLVAGCPYGIDMTVEVEVNMRSRPRGLRSGEIIFRSHTHGEGTHGADVAFFAG